MLSQCALPVSEKLPPNLGPCRHLAHPGNAGSHLMLVLPIASTSQLGDVDASALAPGFPPASVGSTLPTCSQIPLADRHCKLAFDRGFDGQPDRTWNHVRARREPEGWSSRGRGRWGNLGGQCGRSGQGCRLCLHPMATCPASQTDA
jgi:hypothetical protein